MSTLFLPLILVLGILLLKISVIDCRRDPVGQLRGALAKPRLNALQRIHRPVIR